MQQEHKNAQQGDPAKPHPTTRIRHKPLHLLFTSRFYIEKEEHSPTKTQLRLRLRGDGRLCSVHRRLLSRRLTCGNLLQPGQTQLSPQLIGAANDAIHNTIAIHALRLAAKRLEQVAQRGVAFQGHALHFQQLLGAHARLDGKAGRQFWLTASITASATAAVSAPCAVPCSLLSPSHRRHLACHWLPSWRACTASIASAP